MQWGMRQQKATRYEVVTPLVVVRDLTSHGQGLVLVVVAAAGGGVI